MGHYTVLASFPGSIDYGTATTLVDFAIGTATPQVTWSVPQSIVYGTPLSGTQLDARANVSGSYVYDPAAGTILGVGTSQVLTVTFLPADATDFTTVGSGTTITVIQATPVLHVAAAGGAFNGSPFAASVTVTGVVDGNDNTPAATLERVAPTLTYYAGSGSSRMSLGSTPPSAPGTYTVVAAFAGSTDYAATQSAAVGFVIGQAPRRSRWPSSAGSRRSSGSRSRSSRP